MTNQRKEYFADMIQHNDRWLERGILAIWKYQTKSEKQQVTTNHYNGVGFNGPDGHFMTSLGNILNKGYHLSEKQKFVARKKMMKYVGQLIRIADNNHEEKLTNMAIEADNWVAKQFEEGKVTYVNHLLEAADAQKRAAVYCDL